MWDAGVLEPLAFSLVRLCQGHTVTLCLIGTGQSPRGMKGYAHPILLPVSLSLSLSQNMAAYTSPFFFKKLINCLKGQFTQKVNSPGSVVLDFAGIPS